MKKPLWLWNAYNFSLGWNSFLMSNLHTHYVYEHKHCKGKNMVYGLFFFIWTHWRPWIVNWRMYKREYSKRKRWLIYNRYIIVRDLILESVAVEIERNPKLSELNYKNHEIHIILKSFYNYRYHWNPKNFFEYKCIYSFVTDLLPPEIITCLVTPTIYIIRTFTRGLF